MSDTRFKALAEHYSLIRLNGKRPRENHWQQYCLEKRKFKEIGFRDGDNAGIACGPASGLLVLDIDDEKLFEAVKREHNWTVPETRTIRTGSGGTHHYFRYPDDGKHYGNKGRAHTQGFDVRGVSGCVVAPGSVHPETGKPYQIEIDVPVVAPPEWLLDLYKEGGTASTTRQKWEGEVVPIELEPVSLDDLALSKRVRRLIEGELPVQDRSKAMWEVLCALVDVGTTDGQIITIFEQYPIGEKYLEKGVSRQVWLLPQISKVREELQSTLNSPMSEEWRQEEASLAKAKQEREAFIAELDKDPKRKTQAYATLDAIWNRPINGINHKEVTERACGILKDNLIKYGNTPNNDHLTALLEVLYAYTRMAQGSLQGRYAFPLATGMGKTQSIVAWVSALYKAGITHVSLAVCASKVEALCDLKRDLIGQGVPSEVIGLLHSYKYDAEHARDYLENGVELPGGFASLPCTEDHQGKQILLVTHNRVRGNGQFDLFHLFKGKPRDLLIWDESLFISNTRAISEVEIKSAVGWWKPRIGQDETKAEVISYLDQCIQLLDSELEAQRQEDRPPIALRLPPLTFEKVRDFKKTIGDSITLSVLPDLLDISQVDIRVVDTPQRGGFVSYDIAVPAELKNIIILDASYNIRELEKYDRTIKKTSLYTDDVVSYERVTVHQLYHASGRKKMEESFSQAQKENRLVGLEITEVVKSIPQEQGVIIFTFKERRGVNFKQVLRADLSNAGVDVDAKVSVLEEKKPRFVWLTWGQETSLSQHKYCSNVIFAGVLHRSHVDLASCILGQQDNIRATIRNDEIQRVERSEIAHCLYQAMSRGSCRMLEDSKAKPMNVWLIHKDREIKAWIREVMPGVEWTDWESSYLKSKGKVDQVARQIQEYLNTQPSTVMKIPTRTIKQKLGLRDIPSRTFTRAIEEVCSQRCGWFLDSRSLARDSSVFF